MSALQEKTTQISIQFNQLCTKFPDAKQRIEANLAKLDEEFKTLETKAAEVTRSLKQAEHLKSFMQASEDMR